MFKGDFELTVPASIYKRTITQSKSPRDLLQLIKQKRSKINTMMNSPEQDERVEKRNKLVLPKILAMRHSSCDNRVEILSSRLSNISKSSAKRTQLYNKSHQTLEPLNMNYVDEESQQSIDPVGLTTQLFKIIQNLPQMGKQKRVEKLFPLMQFLIDYNPLFKNTSKTLLLSLIKCSKIRYFQSNKWIYKKNDRLISFYVILWGKVRLVNSQKNFKKTSVKGQTLCEHVLFNQWSQHNVRGQGCKTSVESFILEISYKTYLIFYKQMVMKGYKSEFLALQTLIKRNYILKQSLRKF